MRSQHTRNPGYEPGNHWNTCQRCGFDMRANESLQEWTGLIVCEDCWEERHPQEFVEAPVEDIAPQGLHTSKPTDTYVVVASGLKFNFKNNSMYLGVI